MIRFIYSFVFFVLSFVSFVVNGFQLYAHISHLISLHITLHAHFYFFSKAASKAISEDGKSTFLTNPQASFAPNSLSIPLSSHSTDKGPLYLIELSALMISSKSMFPWPRLRKSQYLPFAPNSVCPPNT